MANKRFKVLTTCIVSALHVNEPTEAGAIYQPEAEHERVEALALEKVGYVVETKDDATHKTILQRGKDAPKISGVDPNIVKQEDGTYRNGNGQLVDETGTLLDVPPPPAPNLDTQTGSSVDLVNDEELTNLLKGKADDVIPAIAKLSPAQAKRAGELEASTRADKARSTVIAAANERAAATE